MITRVVNIDTEEHAKEFDALVAKLGYVKSVRKLTVKEAALGIGRKATELELNTFLMEDEEDKQLIPSEEVFRKFKDWK